ncbi:DUF6297 family protein [Nonomuraea coxensis]|uniref:DUF6297 family protein n=1 Tax=Nonomuraea coxensis TaxID=404386 RepID=UPI0012F843D5|nr:DUF6297 family protein [Nonomuraea coxensis]
MDRVQGGVRAVRGFLRERSRTRSTPIDRYVTAFCLLMFAAVAGQPVSEVLTGLAGPAGAVEPARVGAGVALLALGLAGFLAVARAAGPVLMTAPDASWLLLSPLDRRQVLGRTGRALLMVAVAAGLVLGLGLVAALGAPDQLAWRVLGALVLGVSASVGAMALAVLARASQSWQAWLVVALAVLLVVAVVAVSGQARGVLAVASAAPLTAVAVAATLAAAGSALLARQAWRAFGRIPAREIAAASTRGGHVADAATGIDPGALTWIVEDNHWRGRRLRSRRWPGLPAALATAWQDWPGLPAAFATAWQDWRRLARRPGRLAFTLATAGLPALLAQAGGAPGMLGAVVLAGGLAVAASAATGARRDAANPALARLLGIGHRPALAARAALPALLAALWTSAALAGLALTSAAPSQPSATTAVTTTATVPAPGSATTTVPAAAAAAAAAAERATGGVASGADAHEAGAAERGLSLAEVGLFGVLAAPALAAGALRMVRRRPVDHSLPVIDTGAGPVPLGPVLWGVTGIDLAAAGCLPALLALATAPPQPGPYLVAQAVTGAAALAGYVLRAGKAT